MTKLNLPEPISAYFEPDKRDGEAVARCFTREGVSRTRDKRTQVPRPSRRGRLWRPPSSRTRASRSRLEQKEGRL